MPADTGESFIAQHTLPPAVGLIEPARGERDIHKPKQNLVATAYPIGNRILD
jgi:hypothetical protein